MEGGRIVLPGRARFHPRSPAYNPRPPMSARSATALLLAALAACGRPAPPTPAAEPARPPNVLFVLLDTLRPDHLGCYGSKRPVSAHLDALAQRSALFEHAQSAAPLTVA